MIEMVLALGVLAIGLTSVMALFPVGVNANRDSMAEGYAAGMGDEILHQVEYWMRLDEDGWDEYVNSGGSSRLREYANRPLAANFTPGSYGADETMFLHPNAVSNPTTAPERGLYKVIRFVDQDADDIYDPGSDVLDFEAIARVWREQVSIPTSSGTLTPPYAIAAALNIEVSWPAALPYSQRQKSTFRYELFNR